MVTCAKRLLKAQKLYKKDRAVVKNRLLIRLIREIVDYQLVPMLMMTLNVL